MDIHLGTLQFLPAKGHPELVSSTVATALHSLGDVSMVGVAEIDSSLSDTAAFCEHYKVTPEQAANCVVLEAKRGDRNWFAACVVLASTRIDVNGVARRTLDARKVSFAPMEEAVSQSAMEYGAITPVGLPDNWSILVDQAVADAEYMIIGSGIRGSKLAVPGSFFAMLPNVQVVEGLAVVRL